MNLTVARPTILVPADGKDLVSMRQARLAGVRRGKLRRTTFRNRLWVVDLTYVPIGGGGFSCIAFVIDAFARLIADWQVVGHLPSAHMRDNPRSGREGSMTP